jgi:hypothetical protein
MTKDVSIANVTVGETITFSEIDSESGTETGGTYTGKISKIGHDSDNRIIVTFVDGRTEPFGDGDEMVEVITGGVSLDKISA